MEERDTCLQCGDKLEEHVYAVYWGKDDPQQGISKEEVAGYLCNRCRGKQKVKELKKKNPWEKLEQLKNTLK